jgi:transcriptional regulator of PTS gene
MVVLSFRQYGDKTNSVGAVVGALNTASVLNEIRRKGVVSRVELADNLVLGRSTITDITQRLLVDGHIREVRVDSAGTESGRGRPRIGLGLNPKAAHVAGIKISMHQIAISIADFACNLVGSTVVPVRTSKQSPAVVADLIHDALRKAAADAGLATTDLDGVGVGVPGFIDGATGMCHWSPVFRDADVPFAQLLAERLHLPVFVENDANLVALAEHWFGEGADAEELVVVTIEHGVGMGLVLDGRIFRGSHGFASEFGHTQVVPDGAPCRCGLSGCVEAYISDYALVRAAGIAGGQPNLADPFELERAVVAITDKARAGDPVLRKVFADAGVILGRGIANLVKVVDPQRIIFCGNGLRAVDLWFDAMRTTVAALLRHPAGRDTEFRIHRWGDDVWARGAAAYVLQALYQSHKAFLHPMAESPKPAATLRTATPT